VPDLEPAARELTRLVQGVRDDQLDAPTPCPDYRLGDLLEHVHGLALAFTAAARKERLPGGPVGPSGDASRLPEDWRTSIAARLEELARAWREPGAWEGTTAIATFDGAPADQVGVTAVNELVVHGWDVARASGQDITVHDESIGPCLGFAGFLTGPDGDAMRQAGPAFGPPVDVPGDASVLDRVVAANGRQPRWAPDRPASR
jgi:uncharacterized protein (TIGR03086 family)